MGVRTSREHQYQHSKQSEFTDTSAVITMGINASNIVNKPFIFKFVELVFIFIVFLIFRCGQGGDIFLWGSGDGVHFTTPASSATTTSVPAASTSTVSSSATTTTTTTVSTTASTTASSAKAGKVSGSVVTEESDL